MNEVIVFGEIWVRTARRVSGRASIYIPVTWETRALKSTSPHLKDSKNRPFFVDKSEPQTTPVDAG